MELNIRARHIDLTPALSDYMRKKVEKAQRYDHSIVWAQAVLSVEKHRQIAELIVHTPGNTFRTVGESPDLYSAIDIAVHKLDLHLSRTREKLKNHRFKENLKNAAIIPATALKPNKKAFSKSIPGTLKKISDISTVKLQTMPMEEAMQELESKDLDVYPFVNEKNSEIHILYKKSPLGYGLIQTEES